MDAHKEWLSKGCTLRNWDAFGKDESFVGHTNTMKTRIFSFYYTLGSLESKRNRLVPKDYVYCS